METAPTLPVLTAEEIEILGLSLKVAFWAVLLGLPPAVAVAHLLARGRFAGRTLLDAIVHLPLVLPPVVVGYLLLIVFGRHATVGGWLADHLGIVFAFRWTGAALAAGIMGFPLMVRAVRLSIEGIDTRIEQAASSLGAPPLSRFLLVTMPLALPGVLTGALLAFARSLGEFGATITFVSSIPGETRTLPLAIYGATQAPGGETEALRLSIVSVVLSLAALIASELLTRRAQRQAHGRDAER
jgi:molybdate transport system permease protein